MKVLVLALVAIGLLMACSETPTTLANPRDSIMLQYDAAKTSQSDAEDVAQKHCESWGRNAVASRNEQKDGHRIQSFDCR